MLIYNFHPARATRYAPTGAHHPARATQHAPPGTHHPVRATQYDVYVNVNVNCIINMTV